MKRFMGFLLALVLVLSLAGMAQADYYYPVYSGLKSSLATRSGPSTDYNELGTFFQNGWRESTVRAYSRANHNGINWVQIEFSYNNVLYRAYTTESRLSADVSALPEEREIGAATVVGGASVQGYLGPGTNYKATFYKVPANVQLAVYDVVNGFAQVDYPDSATFYRHRCWVQLDYLTYSGNIDGRGISYVTPTPTPTPTPAQPENRGAYDWGSGEWHSDDWAGGGDGPSYSGDVVFAENDTYLLNGRSDTGFVVTSGVDLNGCAMIELTVVGEITYHNVYLFMESADVGTFTTVDGREGMIRFFDNYALLDMDLRFAGIGEEIMLIKIEVYG